MSAGVIYTYSGQMINLLDPHPDMIVWDDVFRALSFENRYNGHTSQPYSVGQHLVAMAMYLEDHSVTTRRVALIHDFPEYVLKDVTRPLKPLLGIGYGQLTVAWENAFCDKLGIFDGPFMRRVMDADVKVFDLLAWRAEAEFLQPNRPDSIEPCGDDRMLACVALAAQHTPAEIQRELSTYLKELF